MEQNHPLHHFWKPRCHGLFGPNDAKGFPDDKYKFPVLPYVLVSFSVTLIKSRVIWDKKTTIKKMLTG